MFHTYAIEVFKFDGSSYMIKEGGYYGDFLDEVEAANRAAEEQLKPEVVTTRIHTQREM